MTADDHAPTRGSRGAELRGTDAFRALLEGRLTVVDRFDRDGRTFLVTAHSHTLTLPERALSTQERRAASLVRLGHATKAIAFHLGLSESRVSTLMRAVAEKLGARSRVDLVRLLASLPDLADSEHEARL